MIRHWLPYMLFLIHWKTIDLGHVEQNVFQNHFLIKVDKLGLLLDLQNADDKFNQNKTTEIISLQQKENQIIYFFNGQIISTVHITNYKV